MVVPHRFVGPRQRRRRNRDAAKQLAGLSGHHAGPRRDALDERVDDLGAVQTRHRPGLPEERPGCVPYGRASARLGREVRLHAPFDAQGRSVRIQSVPFRAGRSRRGRHAAFQKRDARLDAAFRRQLDGSPLRAPEHDDAQRSRPPRGHRLGMQQARQERNRSQLRRLSRSARQGTARGRAAEGPRRRFVGMLPPDVVRQP